MKIESLINYTHIVKLLEQSEEVSEIMSYQMYEVHVSRNKQPDFIKNTAAETVVHFRYGILDRRQKLILCRVA